MNALAALVAANRLMAPIAPRTAGRVARRLLMTPMPPPPGPTEVAMRRRAEPVTFRFGLRGLRWGHAGPVVLALHGWSGRPTQFAGLVEPLLAHGRQLIAIEAPGHAPGEHRQSHVYEFVEALLDAGTEIRDLDAVVGHSMGGAAALYVAAVHTPVRRVATIGAPAALDRVLDRFALNLGLTDTARAAFRRSVERRVGIPASELDARRFGAMLRFEGLVVHDRRDPDVPFAEAEALVAAWPSARLHATDGLGHTRILRDASVARMLADFLAGRDVQSLVAA
jgi:pimeloyl-ACP methyl ester carboxylesterase